MKVCPFCHRELTKHHPQCHYGNIPSADDIKNLQDRKKEVDGTKLKNTKSALAK